MKYCISGRQPKSVLEKTDEIKMRYSDKERMVEYMREWPEKTFILDVPKGTEIDFPWCATLASENNLILCLGDLSLAKLCSDFGLAFYWSFPITSYYELHGVIDLKPAYIFLGAPLFFDLKMVTSITDIPVRLCPNLAFDAYVPREDGVYGTWIRPEDVAAYEKYVSTLEFVYRDLDHEKVLLHIYKENATWPGNLNLLLTNFNVNVDNRAIADELAETRMNCGQRCMRSGTCHFCDTAVRFANAVRDKHYENLKNAKKDESHFIIEDRPEAEV